MAAGGGVADRGSDELWSTCGKFYYYVVVEVLVCARGVCTSQRPATSVMGTASPGTFPGVNRDLPHGISERPDQDTAGSSREGTGNYHHSLFLT